MAHHVVALALTHDGHINPLLQFCHRLVPFGFHTSFITTPHFVSKLSLKLGDQNGIKLIPFSGYERFHFDYTEQLLDSLEGVIKGLDEKVDCFITDAFLGWTQDLASRFGVPRVAQWTSTTACLVVSIAIPLLRSKGYFPVTDKEDDRLVSFLAGLPALRVRHLPLVFRTMPAPLQVLVERTMQRLSEAQSVVINTVEELEQEVLEAQKPDSNWFAVGPMIPIGNEVHGPDEASVLKWLDFQPAASVLYIAFGSYLALPIQQVEKIASSLEASKLPFLWAFRKNLVAGGPQGYREGLAEKFAGQGLIEEWTPQAKVLSHSAVGGFLTHAGWNSALEAMLNGVPLLCWPCGAEQNLSTYFLVDQWKVGLRVTEGADGDVSRECILELMLSLMTGQAGVEMRNKMQKYKELLRGVWNEGGSSYKNLMNFVESLRRSLARREIK